MDTTRAYFAYENGLFFNVARIVEHREHEIR